MWASLDWTSTSLCDAPPQRSASIAHRPRGGLRRERDGSASAARMRPRRSRWPDQPVGRGRVLARGLPEGRPLCRPPAFVCCEVGIEYSRTARTCQSVRTHQPSGLVARCVGDDSQSVATTSATDRMSRRGSAAGASRTAWLSSCRSAPSQPGSQRNEPSCPRIARIPGCVHHPQHRKRPCLSSRCASCSTTRPKTATACPPST